MAVKVTLVPAQMVLLVASEAIDTLAGKLTATVVVVDDVADAAAHPPSV